MHHHTNQPLQFDLTYSKNKGSVIIRKRQTHTDLAEYLHASCYGPVKSTFLKAIKKGFFKTWPRLSEETIRKHLYPQIATAKGHLAQTRQHLQSTKLATVDNKTYLDNIRKNIKALKSSIAPTGTRSLKDVLWSAIDLDFSLHLTLLTKIQMK